MCQKEMPSTQDFKIIIGNLSWKHFYIYFKVNTEQAYRIIRYFPVCRATEQLLYKFLQHTISHTTTKQHLNTKPFPRLRSSREVPQVLPSEGVPHIQRYPEPSHHEVPHEDAQL